MTIHTKHQRPRWQEVKGRLIAKHKTVMKAAIAMKCHPNALRRAIEGGAPNVLDRMKEAGFV